MVSPLHVNGWSSMPNLAEKMAVAVQAAQLGAKSYPDLKKKATPVANPRPQPCSGTTQVATTTGSYQKAAQNLRKFLADRPNARVLDYGAGLGLGTQALRKGLEKYAQVEGFEPLPERSQVEPDYTNSGQIRGQYDAIVNLNVLNVLEKTLRDQVLLDIAKRLLPGGRAIIGVRPKGSVTKAKSGRPGKESGSVWINKKGVECYQKGFDGEELLDYATGLLGSQYRVRRISYPTAVNIEIERVWGGSSRSRQSRNPHTRAATSSRDAARPYTTIHRTRIA